jgi:SAM-dependent methyltransferase
MDNYYKKYLIYKKKYLDLKESLKVKESKRTEWVNIDKETADKFKENDYPDTYGELTAEGFDEILKNIDLQPSQSKFIDLGSGLGKVPLMAVVNHNFKYAKGVEYARERHEQALKVLDKYSNYKNRVDLEHGDLFNEDIGDYDLIFVSNLCFNEEPNKKLGVKLKDAKKNSYIVVSKPIEAEHLELLNNIQVKTTWTNKSNVYLYRRI